MLCTIARRYRSYDYFIVFYSKISKYKVYFYVFLIYWDDRDTIFLKKIVLRLKGKNTIICEGWDELIRGDVSNYEVDL